MKRMLFLITISLVVLTHTACSVRPGDEKRKTQSTYIYLDGKDRGWLGVSIENISSNLARKKDLKSRDGAYVRNVEEESPAEAAGIHEGDVITEYDGKKIYDSNDLIEEVRSTKPGKEVFVTVLRDGDKKSLKATIDKAPRSLTVIPRVPTPPRFRIEPPLSLMRSSALYGLTLENLNKQLGEYFGAPDGKGVLVKNVKRDSEAEKAGFKAGDVIVKIGKESIRRIDDIHYVLEDYKSGDKADVEVLRKGSAQKLTLTVRSRDRDVSEYYFHHGDDVILDLLSPEDHDRFREEMLKLENNLGKMRLDLQDSMKDLKENLRKKIRDVRISINV
ncbi:MAG: PDZ domain-containing protein [Bacteroidetes bacterium]|nr:PDZ domain-containing protein [Bacteroidota bacterium]MCW5895744.1 PDZ domain-containing protein [Bacteroidota bacterium]